MSNAARYKAAGDESANVDRARIERAYSIVRERRLRRTTLQFRSTAAAVDSRPEADLFAILGVHGDALLALLRSEEEAAELVVRAVFTATEVFYKRVQKKRDAAENDAEDDL